MTELIKSINDNYSDLISLIITFILCWITYKQMKIARKATEVALDQLKLNKQPYISLEVKKTDGTHCFSGDRRQLHINIELLNAGDSPAINVYTFAHLELQHTKNKYNDTNVVDMDYIPNFKNSVKVNENAIAQVRFETREINMLVNDLRHRYVKNIERIEYTPCKSPYKGTILVVEVFYRNVLGQWFRHILRQGILRLIDNKKNTIPPCELKEDTCFTLQLISPQFSVSTVELIDESIINKKLEQYKEELYY